MKILSAFLALMTALPTAGRTAEEAVAPSTSAAEATGSTWTATEPITVTAPRVKDQAALETARAAGTGVAVAGSGFMAYLAIGSVAGPFGWVAAMTFMGVMTAYLSHRRLQGKDDFSWSAPPPKTVKAP